MAFTVEYPSGTDYKVYITDPVTDASITPAFDKEQAIDVVSVQIREDGNVLPLYDVSRRTVDHFAYSRRMVNGALQFNFSVDYIKRWRSPIQTIRDKTMWVVLNYVRWKPLQVVRDIFRISDVWEHAFTHSPNPHAMEQVPFSGRDLTLIERQTADIREDIQARLFTDSDRVSIGSTDDLFKDTRATYTAKVVEVTDGDTLVCVINGLGDKEYSIRLTGADTPETPKGPGESGSRNRVGSGWIWPSTAPPPNEDNSGPLSRGKFGRSPTVEQLNAWGTFVQGRVRVWFGADSEGNVNPPKPVTLERDPGTAPIDKFDRPLFKVRLSSEKSDVSLEDVPEADYAYGQVQGRYLSTFLVRCGYAKPYAADSYGVRSNGTVYNHRKKLSKIYSEMKQAGVVGTTDSAGMFYSHDHEDWKNRLALQ